MLRIWLAGLFSRRNVQKRAQLQNLCRVHGDKSFSGLETDGIPLVLHQPGVQEVKKPPPQLAASFGFGRCCFGEDAVVSGESAVRAIVALLTALLLCASASAGLAQQNAVSQPVPYLNAQAAPPTAATRGAPAAPQTVAPAADQPTPPTATAVPAASAPEAGGDNARSL